ncbi:unnamed protein product [Rhizophagus irregularis]|nr:unnamed protein product [Rhizophagus irregularis]
MNITKTRNTSVKMIKTLLWKEITPRTQPTRIKYKREEKNQTTLQSDSIPVSSDGDGEIEAYDPDDKVPKNVTDNGNSAEGDDGEL